jgi:predicted MFS family arabinose efflux permease
MKFPEFKPPAVKKKVASELSEGFKYLQQTPAIGMLIILMTCLSLLVLPYDTIVPVFAKVIFKGNAATYGYITGAVGAGALIGSFILASVKKGINFKPLLLASIVILGTGLILFSRMAYLPIALSFAVILGLGSITPMSISITMMQMEAAANMRGRVMSYVAMAYFGMLPLGSLLIGNISQKIGAPVTMLCQGVLALLIAAVFAKLLPNAQNQSTTTNEKHN